ncbi:hypothetical protein SDC49_11020 [Lactobacillus sp. R2/2]|nr:hypothetical protein [Lactobacillus sp. R2/2]
MLNGQVGLLVLKLGDNVKNFSQMGLNTPGIWFNVGGGSLQNLMAKINGHQMN